MTCPLCGSNLVRWLGTMIHVLRGFPPVADSYQCLNCGTGFKVPRP